MEIKSIVTLKKFLKTEVMKKQTARRVSSSKLILDFKMFFY